VAFRGCRSNLVVCRIATLVACRSLIDMDFGFAIRYVFSGGWVAETILWS
jgi:hypothetical protein